jgi:hypothetical protein
MCSASCCVCDDSSMSLITLSCAVASLLFRRASSSCRSTATLRIHSRFAATRLACHPPAPGNQRRRAHGASRAALTSTAKARTPVTSLLRFIFIAPARWRGDVVSLSKLSLSRIRSEGDVVFPPSWRAGRPHLLPGRRAGTPSSNSPRCVCVCDGGVPCWTARGADRTQATSSHRACMFPGRRRAKNPLKISPVRACQHMAPMPVRQWIGCLRACVRACAQEDACLLLA